MKYFIVTFLITLSLLSAKVAVAGQHDYSVSCNYCSQQGKQVKAEQAAFIDGQLIKVIDQQGNSFIIDEYQVTSGGSDVVDYDEVITTHLITHSKTSAVAQTVSNAYQIMKAAAQQIKDETATIELPSTDYYQSAFQIMEQVDYFSIKMSDRIMNDPRVKSQFDIIEAQTQNLKANLSVSIPFLGTGLSLGNQIIVRFTDGTKAYLNVELKTSTGTNVYINLKFHKAVDKEGNPIPTKAYGLVNYREGEILTEENTGNMDYFSEWFAKLEVAGVKIVRGGTGHGGGSSSITDCHYEIRTNSNGTKTARLICN